MKTEFFKHNEHSFLAKVWVPAHKRTVFLQLPESTTEFVDVPDIVFYLFYEPDVYFGYVIQQMYVFTIVDGKEHAPLSLPNGHCVCFGSMFRRGTTAKSAIENCIDAYWSTEFEYSFNSGSNSNRFKHPISLDPEFMESLAAHYKPVVQTQTN